MTLRKISSSLHLTFEKQQAVSERTQTRRKRITSMINPGAPRYHHDISITTKNKESCCPLYLPVLLVSNLLVITCKKKNNRSSKLIDSNFNRKIYLLAFICPVSISASQAVVTDVTDGYFLLSMTVPVLLVQPRLTASSI